MISSNDIKKIRSKPGKNPFITAFAIRLKKSIEDMYEHCLWVSKMLERWFFPLFFLMTIISFLPVLSLRNKLLFK
jgi:hypothetical protein